MYYCTKCHCWHKMGNLLTQHKNYASKDKRKIQKAKELTKKAKRRKDHKKNEMQNQDKKIQTGNIVQGDCLKVLKQIPKGTIDLIYLDPPFFSNKDYDMPFTDKKSITAFKDTVTEYEKMSESEINKALHLKLIRSDKDFWKRDMRGLLLYLAYMKDRLEQCHRVLKDTGSMYLHCNWHASHYLKIVMDQIFGYKKFRNEIIWHKKGGIKAISNIYPRKYDSILFYTKSSSNNHTFNILRGATRDNALYKRWIKYSKDGKTVLYGDFPRTDKVKFNDYTKRFISRHGRKPKDNDVIYEFEGTILDSVWPDIADIYRGQKEKLGYPTQKPETLLERIIKASSNEGDVVLDPMCGCGTAIAIAARLNRKFIGIDISPVACKVMKERLLTQHQFGTQIIETQYTLNEIKKMDWYRYQMWACDKLYAIPGGKGADRGIDGEGELKEKNKILPFLIQAKKWKSNVGADRVMAFKGALDNKETKYGVIVANGFSEKAIKQADEYYERGQAEIRLVTTKMLVEGYDLKEKTKWNIILPNYAPWKKQNKELTSFGIEIYNE